MKKNLLAQENGVVKYSEVKDSLLDGLNTINNAEDTLEDGWQWTDIIALAKEQPVIEEIIRDAPVFWNQFKNLSGDDSIALVLDVKQELSQRSGGEPNGKIANFILRLLYFAASSFNFSLSVFQQGQANFLLGKNLINNGPVFPDEF